MVTTADKCCNSIHFILFFPDLYTNLQIVKASSLIHRNVFLQRALDNAEELQRQTQERDEAMAKAAEEKDRENEVCGKLF